MSRAICDETNPSFTFEGQTLRGVILDGKPWFVAKDACMCVGLSIASISKHLAKLDADEKDRNIIPTLGGRQLMNLVSEPGLYKLVQHSSKPAAKRFDRWVRHEVLPAIRKNGAYVMKGADVAAASCGGRGGLWWSPN